VDKADTHLLLQTLPRHGPVLGVFAKQPRAGKVKTRLVPPLFPAQARALYRVALQETVTRFSCGPAALVLCYAGRQTWFARSFAEMPRLPQGRGDLGTRLARAMTTLFAAGGGPVALAGADSPDLPLPLVARTFTALETADIAAIPCRDGGYALLALRRPAPGVFSGIPWSTPAVLAATQQRAAELGLRFATVGGWEDLDDLASLQRLVLRSPECMTAQYARAHLGRLLPSGCG
jgi:rSAM/selenodomain-associated transferase 1